MNLPTLTKNISEKLFKSVFSDTSWQRVKNIFRPLLMKIGCMPDLPNDEKAWYGRVSKEFITYLTVHPDAPEVLKKNLDSESIAVVERFIDLLPYFSSEKSLKRNVIFTQEDFKNQMQSIKDIQSKKDSYKRFVGFVGFDYYPVETFWGLNGLRWVPDDVIRYITNGTMLDIGAYNGDTDIALYYHGIHPKNTFAFEPTINNVRKLKENLEILGDASIIPVQLGLSNRKGLVKILNNTSASQIHENGDEEIEITTIDSFVKENDIQKVSLVKMDIEGEEMKALQGGIETIKRDRPVVSVAIYHNPNDFFEIKPWLEEHLQNYSFKIQRTNPFDPMVEVTLLAWPKI